MEETSAEGDSGFIWAKGGEIIDLDDLDIQELENQEISAQKKVQIQFGTMSGFRERTQLKEVIQVIAVLVYGRGILVDVVNLVSMYKWFFKREKSSGQPFLPLIYYGIGALLSISITVTERWMIFGVGAVVHLLCYWIATLAFQFLTRGKGTEGDANT